PHSADDKAALVDAIKNHDFHTVAKEYRLIEQGGANVVVPYGSEQVVYAVVRDAIGTIGLTHALMKQARDITVSEAAMTGVNAALTHLIASAKTFGGSKLVHWYSGTREPRTDPVVALFGDDLPPEEESDATDENAEREALTAAGRLIESLNRNLKAILPMPPSRGRDLKHS
ncbi:MAG: hypothetical protein RRY95_04915, partial [Oscillospiraceae bacterium]